MKLIRFGSLGREKPGVVLPDGARIDCSAFGQDWNEAFFGSGGVRKLRSWLGPNLVHCSRIG